MIVYVVVQVDEVIFTDNVKVNTNTCFKVTTKFGIVAWTKIKDHIVYVYIILLWK